VKEPAEADRLLKESHVGMLVVFRTAARSRQGKDMAMRVAEMGGWRMAVRRGRIEIYVPPDVGRERE
jgi:hypothetical protein